MIDNALVSVIIPCLNEQRFIEGMIKDILKQNISLRQLDIIFIDGGSTDRTIEFVNKYKKRLKAKLIRINAVSPAQAINKGIEEAQGEVIVRLNAHCRYPNDYIENLLLWLEKTQADNVGGSWHFSVPKPSWTANAIAAMIGHPFGGGYVSYKSGFLDYVEYVDSVPFGCFPKTTFEKYGLFNEKLFRHHDLELNKRIINGGGKVLLVPDVYSTYPAPPSYYKLWKNAFKNGKWIALAPVITGKKNLFEYFHYLPFFFIIFFVLIIGVSFFLPFSPFTIMLCSPILIYFFLIGRVSLSVALKKERLELFFFLATAFFILHLSYGLGFLWGYIGRIWLPKQKAG